jgi:hypothetical protein
MSIDELKIYMDGKSVLLNGHVYRYLDSQPYMVDDKVVGIVTVMFYKGITRVIPPSNRISFNILLDIDTTFVEVEHRIDHMLARATTTGTPCSTSPTT